MSWLFAFAAPFIGHPWRAVAVAAFALLSIAPQAFGGTRNSKRVSLSSFASLVLAACWLVFGVLEAEALREHADIRIDLIFTWPAICLVSLMCLVVWFRGLTKSH
jgi:uncharacterized protein with PQ loop repeat